MNTQTQTSWIEWGIRVLQVGYVIYSFNNQSRMAEQCKQGQTYLQYVKDQIINNSMQLSLEYIKSDVAIQTIQKIISNVWSLARKWYTTMNPELAYKNRLMSPNLFDNIFIQTLLKPKEKWMAFLDYNEELALRYTKFIMQHPSLVQDEQNRKPIIKFMLYNSTSLKKMQYPEDSNAGSNQYSQSEQINENISSIIAQTINQLINNEEDNQIQQHDIYSKDIYEDSHDQEYFKYRRLCIAELVYNKITATKYILTPFRIGTRPIIALNIPCVRSLLYRKLLRLQHACIQLGPFLFDYGVDSTAGDNSTQQQQMYHIIQRSSSINEYMSKSKRVAIKHHIRSTSRSLINGIKKIGKLFQSSKNQKNDNGYQIETVVQGQDCYSEWTSQKDMTHTGWSILDAQDLKILIDHLDEWNQCGKYNILRHNCQTFVIYCLSLIYEANCIAFDYVNNEYKKKLYFVFDYTPKSKVFNDLILYHDKDENIEMIE